MDELVSTQVSGGPSRAGNSATQQRPEASEQSLVTSKKQKYFSQAEAWRRKCGVVEDEAGPRGLGKALHPVSKETADQSGPVTIFQSRGWLEAGLELEALPTPSPALFCSNRVPAVFAPGTQTYTEGKVAQHGELGCIWSGQAGRLLHIHAWQGRGAKIQPALCWPHSASCTES